MKIGIGKASGKIILMGEHAVVYGEPAIAIPFLGTKVVVTAESNYEDALESIYYDGPIEFAPSSLKNIIAAFHVAKEKLMLTEPIKIKITSSIPPERGMGSSAAVANAVIRALFDYQKEPLSLDLLKNLADVAEHIAHGNPSGIDQATTSGLRPLYFIKGAPFEEFPLNIAGFLVVADSNLKGRTKETVAHVAELLKAKPELKKTINALGNLTKDTRKALEQNNLSLLAATMNTAQTYLKQLGVSSPTIDDMLTLGLKNGALGGKLTGGGGGGCVIFVTRTKEQVQTLQHALQHAGYPTWNQDFRELR